MGVSSCSRVRGFEPVPKAVPRLGWCGGCNSRLGIAVLQQRYCTIMMMSSDRDERCRLQDEAKGRRGRSGATLAIPISAVWYFSTEKMTST